MKLWIDDVRPAPEGFPHCFSVNEAKRAIEESEKSPWYEHWENGVCVESRQGISLIDIDHDAGDYAADGGIISSSLIGSRKLVAITPFEFIL